MNKKPKYLEIKDEIKSQILNKKYNVGDKISSERELAVFVKSKMLEFGYDEAWIDEVGNVIGKIVGKKPGKKVLFDGHLDTVVVNDTKAWKTNPFQAVITDGKLYGRGATDMKAALAAMIYAGALVAQNREYFAGEYYVSGTVHEE